MLVMKAMKQLQTQDIKIVMGDFNSKVGLKNITIIFGIEEKDERGERLIEFCKEYNLAPVQKSSNTMLDMEKSRG